MSALRLTFGTVTYKNCSAEEKLGQVELSAIAVGAALMVAGLLLLLTLSRFARAPAPGISTAQAPVRGGLKGARTAFVVVAKLSVMPRKPVGAEAKVPLMRFTSTTVVCCTRRPETATLFAE